MSEPVGADHLRADRGGVPVHFVQLHREGESGLARVRIGRVSHGHVIAFAAQPGLGDTIFPGVDLHREQRTERDRPSLDGQHSFRVDRCEFYIHDRVGTQIGRQRPDRTGFDHHLLWRGRIDLKHEILAVFEALFGAGYDPEGAVFSPAIPGPRQIELKCPLAGRRSIRQNSRNRAVRLTERCGAGDSAVDLEPDFLQRYHTGRTSADQYVEPAMHMAPGDTRIDLDHDRLMRDLRGAAICCVFELNLPSLDRPLIVRFVALARSNNSFWRCERFERHADTCSISRRGCVRSWNPRLRKGFPMTRESIQPIMHNIPPFTDRRAGAPHDSRPC